MARLKLISATPSPYARKVHIALHEKNIPSDLIMEVPWESATQTPRYNPLEKLPVLLITSSAESNGNAANGYSTNGHSAGDLGDFEGAKIEQAVYGSSFILEWIEEKYTEPKLYLSGSDEKDCWRSKLRWSQMGCVTHWSCGSLNVRAKEEVGVKSGRRDSCGKWMVG